MRPVKITDLILYTTVLRAAGYKVSGVTAVERLRGSGSTVRGVFTLYGEPVAEVTVKGLEPDAIGDRILIGEQINYVTFRPDGSIELFVAHCDNPG